ncbi:methyltransferase [Haliangium ochraceum]|uniref:O-methyltransferase family 2 n=1 Tax=Haliangium ochraceum (strain DSM 14365 / JCM 11303 / SMP-2) TaxID=502025 RepID=D0LN29_HALO1|nr:methyltransferase [Haliangium ochraceum]ACY13400.1 O-methyltransferase family 2 [Haliangium ochraceum DSM 14365]
MSWREARVAATGTHHVCNGAPLYDERFDEVLKFHEPGLAPVRRGGRAWHIRSDGTAAYEQRFQRTFGFYEGLAAVDSGVGWHHIHPDGRPLTATRYAWCGNFQNGYCAVRDHSGAYVHLTHAGAPAYGARWRYAGDFRDGVAVVQGADGRSTHIDARGDFVHSVGFLDLDVFHKGFARARDEGGWMHVDMAGRAQYRRRFAAVEPFYNGQARVERFDGGLEVIDEAGDCVSTLRSPLRSEFARLSEDMVGFWKTQTIHAAVALGVFEALPATDARIAEVCRLRPARARRLLRALAELGLLERGDDGWQASERGVYLQAAHPWTLAGAAREYGRDFSRMWEALPAALRADSDWCAPDIFGEVATDPERTAAHHQMLASYALHDYAGLPAALALRGDERVIDAGGGLGTLAQLLVAAYPRLRVVVLERAEVVALAEQAQDERVELCTADLFEPWGETGDAVVLARVLHDWDDAEALGLLRRARAALPPGGRVFIVEMLLSDSDMGGSLCDLHLLVATGGKERAEAEYAALLDEAGFDCHGAQRFSSLSSILTGVAR